MAITDIPHHMTEGGGDLVKIGPQHNINFFLSPCWCLSTHERNVHTHHSILQGDQMKAYEVREYGMDKCIQHFGLNRK